MADKRRDDGNVSQRRDEGCPKDSREKEEVGVNRRKGVGAKFIACEGREY